MQLCVCIFCLLCFSFLIDSIMFQAHWSSAMSNQLSMLSILFSILDTNILHSYILKVNLVLFYVFHVSTCFVLIFEYILVYNSCFNTLFVDSNIPSFMCLLIFLLVMGLKFSF